MQSNMNMCIRVDRHGKIFLLEGVKGNFFILFCSTLNAITQCVCHPFTIIKRQGKKI